jgi:hypothetical protein
VKAHEQVTFGFAIKPVEIGITSWKGLNVVYYNGTSTLIPRQLKLDVRAEAKGSCTAPRPAYGPVRPLTRARYPR